ncbi:hypothetical protein ABZ508_02710 [Streptomyces lavendulocolor]|uniref:Uncharacterized protein n=1 Tax=Streptomyces lavendulocolor TaxID=67316 RepID=A0ABV2VYB3_9ACTN
MTPAAEPRHTADTITDDELDRLYAELARLRDRVEAWRAATGAGVHLTDKLRAERDALAAGIPLICSDDRHQTLVFSLQLKLAAAERHAAVYRAAWQSARSRARGRVAAEAALDRVRDRCQGVRDRVGPGGMINASQILGLLSPTWPDGNYEAPPPSAALDEPKEPRP